MASISFGTSNNNNNDEDNNNKKGTIIHNYNINELESSW